MHGFGYIYGDMQDADPSFYTGQWCDEYKFVSSHTGELQELRHYLKYKHIEGSKILVWITDCMSAMWSVNKGRCKEDSGLIVLEDILEMCDKNRIQLVALWIPREENELCDYLSHLSVMLDREEHEGRSVRNLCVLRGDGGEGRRKEVEQGDPENRQVVRGLVYKPGVEFVPSLHVSSSSGLHMSARKEE